MATRSSDVCVVPVPGDGPSSLSSDVELADLGHPVYLTASLTGFALIAFDVFAPNSPHLLLPIDQAVHHWAQGIDPDLRKGFFDHLLSNISTLFATVGWLVATATGVSRRNRTAWAALGLGWALWILVAGPIEGDPLVMGFLKEAFHRARPSDIRLSPSFPSGHTSCEVLLVGALLFVLLPAVYGRREALRSPPPGLLRPAYDLQGSWPLLGLCTAGTIGGRVCADAHWLSDTLAGALLGLALVSGLLQTVRLVEQQLLEPRQDQQL